MTASTRRRLRAGALSCTLMVIAPTLALAGPVEPSPLMPFPQKLSGELPYDVTDVSNQVGRFVKEERIPQAQRLFDIFSWQTFIALNWPADPSGKPILNGPPRNDVPLVWEYWINASQVFKPNGVAPDPWPVSPSVLGRSLQRNRAAGKPHIEAHDTLQAFSGPLVDQNGKWVRYEILMNRTEYDYIVHNTLYNQEGQALFNLDHQVAFPVNDGRKRHGSMEIKLAWKELGPNDIQERFLVRKADLYNPDTGKYERNKLVGLVGMHVAVRTASSPQWIWATFEHVDNVRVKQAELKVNGKYVQMQPNFANLNTPTALPNQLPPMNAVIDPKTGLPVPVTAASTQPPTTWLMANTTNPVQVMRVIPLDPATEELNAQAQAVLRQAGSALQYYELIGTQWPVHPKAPAVPGGQGSAPESIVNKTPGNMVPVYLVNSIMETYFQKGIQNAGPLEQDDRLAPNNDGVDTTQVFGTESCVGCHYSAGSVIGFKKDGRGNYLRTAEGMKLPIYGENSNFGLTGSGNFSWLLQIYAQSTDAPKTHNVPKQPKQDKPLVSHPTP